MADMVKIVITNYLVNIWIHQIRTVRIKFGARFGLKTPHLTPDLRPLCPPTHISDFSPKKAFL